MLIDVDGLEDKVKPQIKNTRKYLELGKNSINSINIPSDFSYRTRLRNIPQSILNIDARVNNIEKWIDTTINNFTNAETSNKGLIESLLSVIPTSVMGGDVVATGGNAVSILNSNDFIDEIKSSVKGAFDYVFSGEWITDSIDMARKTASKIADKIESAVSWAEDIGAEIWEGLKATGASIANAVNGLVKGLGQLIESLLDFIVMLVSGVGSIFTGLADGLTYLVALKTGKTDDWSSITGAMWKGVMGYVAEDHVGNAFKSFYSKTVVGQWLDENAINIFKSAGIGTNITSGVGYIAGIVALTIATLRGRYSCYECCYNIFYSCVCHNSNCCRYR